METDHSLLYKKLRNKAKKKVETKMAFYICTGALSEDWQESEIEKEMAKLHRKKEVQLPPLEKLSETALLELKELERLQQKWDRDRDFV